MSVVRPYRFFVYSIAIVTLASGATAALAGGGCSEPGLSPQSKSATVIDYGNSKGTADASESVTVNAHGGAFDLSSSTGGIAHVDRGSTAVAVWDSTDIHTNVATNVDVDSKSSTSTIVKGSNSISIGISSTEASISINGKNYVVAKELAVAVARSTQFGSSAIVEVEGNLAIPSNGYSAAAFAANKGSR